MDFLISFISEEMLPAIGNSTSLRMLAYDRCLPFIFTIFFIKKYDVVFYLFFYEVVNKVNACLPVRWHLRLIGFCRFVYEFTLTLMGAEE